MNRLVVAEVQRFVSVGLLNTIVGLAVIYAAKLLLQLGDAAANALGYSVGILLGFALNSRWTFAYRGASLPAFARFALTTCVAYVVNLATVLVAIRGGLDSYVAQALGVVPYTVTTFIASKYFVFRAQRDRS
jgi:putative flippase GtrA